MCQQLMDKIQKIMIRNRKSDLVEKIVLSPFQIVSHFVISRYIVFTIYIDTVYID